jgi:hypothetical protein
MEQKDVIVGFHDSEDEMWLVTTLAKDAKDDGWCLALVALWILKMLKCRNIVILFF